MSYKLSFLCIFIFLSAFANAQEIIVEKNFFGYKFSQFGEKITLKDLAKLMEANPEAQEKFKKARVTGLIGNIAGLVGGGIIGYQFVGSSNDDDDEINWPVIGIGAALVSVNLILYPKAIKKLLQAIEIYNSNIDTTLIPEKPVNIFKLVEERRLIVHNYLESDMLDSIKEMDLLINNQYAVIEIYEEEAMLLINRKYKELLQTILRNDTLNFRLSGVGSFRTKDDSLKEKYYYSRFNYEGYDSLISSIPRYLNNNLEALQQHIDTSDLKDEEKLFLKTYLLHHLLSYNYCNVDIEQATFTSSDQFLELYPNSIYAPYIVDNINFKYKKSKWGLGGYVLSGVIIPSGNLKNYIPPVVPFTLGLSTNYWRIYLLVDISPSFGTEIKKDIFYQKMWHKGDRILNSNGALQIGLNVLNTNKFNIMPFVGISGNGLSPYRKDIEDDYYEDVDNITSEKAFIYGLNIDWKWGHSKCEKYKYTRSARFISGYGITRFSISYTNPNFDKKVPALDGRLWQIKIGIGGHSNNYKRIK